MNYQYFLLGGSILLILIATSSALPKAWRLILGLAGVVLVAGHFVMKPVFLGDSPWYNTSPWKEAIAFCLMILGMVCRTLSLSIEKRRAQVSSGQAPGPVSIDKWDLIYPFLVSFITFGGIEAQLTDQKFGIPMLVFAFQNGFFWQTLIGQIETRVAAK